MSDTSEHPLHYSMIIEWSVEDEAFVVSVPEFPHSTLMAHPTRKR